MTDDWSKHLKDAPVSTFPGKPADDPLFHANPWEMRLPKEEWPREYCEGMLKELYWGALNVSKNGGPEGSSCKASAKFFGSALNEQMSTHYDNFTTTGIMAQTTADFFRATIKTPSILSNCSNINILHWTYQMNMIQPDGFKHQLHKTAEACEVPFCAEVQWEGNADVVGKGVCLACPLPCVPANEREMIAAYAIEAVIITLFAMAGVIGFVHSYLYRRKNPNKQFQQTSLDKKRQSFTAFEPLPTEPTKQHKRGRKNFRAALRGTITGFWEGAVMFSISLGVAGLIVFFKKEGSYTLFFSALVSVFSSSCVFVLWPLIDGVTRRKKTYNLLLLATTVQQFILYGIFQYYIRLRLMPNSDHGDKDIKTVDKEKLWEEHCLFLINPKTFIERIVTTTLVFASVVFAKMVIVDYLRPVLLKYRPNWRLSRFFNEQWIKDNAAIMNLAWKAFIGLCGFGMMWASFARIIQGKQRLMNLSGGDNLAGENEWGFGQIVALLTWAPYTLEFIAIWKNGYREGLQKRLPKDVIVSFLDKFNRKSSKDSNTFETHTYPSNRETIYMDRIFNTDEYPEGGYASLHDRKSEKISAVYSPGGLGDIREEIAIVESPTDYDETETGPRNHSPSPSVREFNMATFSPGTDTDYGPLNQF